MTRENDHEDETPKQAKKKPSRACRLCAIATAVIGLLLVPFLSSDRDEEDTSS